MNKIFKILFFIISVILLIIVCYNEYVVNLKMDRLIHPEHAGLKRGALYLVDWVVRILIILFIIILLIFSYFKKKIFYLNLVLLIIALIISFL